MSEARTQAAAPDEQLQAVWQQVLECLRATLNAATYNLAFSNTNATRLEGDRIVLAVETEFARSWVAQRYQAVLKDALFEVLGTDIAVEVMVVPAEPEGPGGHEAAHPALAPPSPVIPAIGRVHGRLQERFLFENFVTGPSNRFAHAAALAVAEQPAQSFNPFFIYGGAGIMGLLSR